MKVLSVLGTRPEAIKMAPVLSALRRRPELVQSIVCSVGQHREMLDQVLKTFEIQPDHELDVMTPNQSLSELTARLFTGLDAVIAVVQPDWVLAQGDTTTVFVASMVSYYRRVAFGHVEAGLRTGDKWRPFPEEINRQIADIAADLHFAPTERARQALLKEGRSSCDVYVTGNTVIDALQEVASREYDLTVGPLSSLPLDRQLVLITAHRRESFGEPFRQLCHAIRDLACRFAGVPFHFVYPVHLNPNVGAPVREILSKLSNVSLIPPIDYLALIHLMKRAVLVLTDSGGIQEEAVGLRVPVLVMRDTTERPEGVEAGAAKLVGTRRAAIVAEADRLLRDPAARLAMTTGTNPYGDGHAGERIVSILLERAGIVDRAASTGAQLNEGQ
ncbi:MAG: UDP-N-acetylglucosamine 2-epimerase (non-hydrolyzing) [Acidobacteriota bacterium]|nr:UDP-N-acetylglucosamine 2-epimerase (non-hydrolyzing) [Acidobacteriota bacterium]